MISFDKSFGYLFVVFFLQVREGVETYGSGSGVLMMWEHLCGKDKTKVMEMGFEPFFTFPLLKADKALLVALAERWSPIMHTYGGKHPSLWDGVVSWHDLEMLGATTPSLW